MMMEYIKRTYLVPAKRGARLRYDGANPSKFGVITSATNSGHIRVRFDGERRTYKLHPTWKLVYLQTV